MAAGAIIPLGLLDALPEIGGAAPAPTQSGVDLQAILQQEGATHLAPIARSIYQQESGGGRNTRTSVDGAHGGFQIIPGTFNRFARPGESIDNPTDNARVGVRYIKALAEKAGGDPAKVFAGYFSGEGNIGTGDQAFKRDYADGNGKRVSSYVADNMKRLGADGVPVAGTGAGKVIPLADSVLSDMGFAPVTQASPTSTKAPGVVDMAGRGLIHGLVGLASDMGTITQALGEKFGARQMADIGKSMYDYWGEQGQKYEIPPELQGNILDNPELLTKGAWWVYNLFDTAPSLAASLLPGVGASRALLLLGKAAKWSPGFVAGLARFGAAATAGAAGGTLEGSQTYQEVLKRGGTPEEAFGAAVAMSLASGVLNAISFDRLTPKNMGLLRRMLTAGATEGITEWAEEPAEGAILQNMTSVGKPSDDPVARLRAGINVVPIAGVLGGLGGAAAGSNQGVTSPAARPQAERDRPADLMQPPPAQPSQFGNDRTQPGLSPYVRELRERTSNLPNSQRVPAGPVDITQLRENVDRLQAPVLLDEPGATPLLEGPPQRVALPGPPRPAGLLEGPQTFRFQPYTAEEAQANLNPQGEDASLRLTPTEVPNLGQGELDLQQAPEAPAVSPNQLHLPVMDTPVQAKVKQGGKLTRSDLIQTLNTVTKPDKPQLTKAGAPRRKWLASIMTSSDPLAAMRETYANGTHPQAELLDKWHQVLSGTSIEQYDKQGGYAPPVLPASKTRARKTRAVQSSTPPIPGTRPKRALTRAVNPAKVVDEERKVRDDLETAYARDEISRDDFEDLNKALDNKEPGAVEQARKVLDYALQTKAMSEKKTAPVSKAANRLQAQLDRLRTSTKSAGRMRKGRVQEAEEPGYDSTGASINTPVRENDEFTDAGGRTKLSPDATARAMKGDLAGTLRQLARDTTSPFHRRLARLLVPITSHTRLTVVSPGTAYSLEVDVPSHIRENKSFGTTLTSVATGNAWIFLNGSEQRYGLNEETVLHEAIHAALLARMHKLGGAAKQMSALWQLYQDYVRDNFTSQSLVPSYIASSYKDFDEFITYSMTSSKFQDFLRKAKIEKQSLWNRFVAVVARVLGFQGNKTFLEHVLDAGVSMLEEAGGVEVGPVGEFEHFDFSNPQSLLKDMNGYVENHMVDELPKDIKQTLTSAGNAARTKWLGAVTLRQLADMYRKVLPAVDKYVGNVHRMDSTVNRISTAASDVAARWGGVKDADALSEVMGLATTQKIHPDLPFAEQTWLKDNARAPQQYNSLREKYAALSPEAKAIYQESKKMLQDHWLEVRELLKAEIGKTFTDPVERKEKLSQIDHEFGRVQGPYFPLSRFGKYILTAKKPGNEASYTVEFFENIFERDAEVRELRRQGFETKTAIASEFNPATDGVPSRFVQGLYQAIDAMPNMQAELAKDLKDAVTQLYWRSLPEVAGAKRFLRRRTIKGWNKDMRRSFANAMFHGAFYRAKLQYAPEMRRALLEMYEQKKDMQDETGSRDLADTVMNEISRRHELAMRRIDTPFVDFLGKVGYVYYLGLTPSFALVNMMQNPLVAYPMLAAKFGWTRAFSAMIRAAKEFAGVRFTPDDQGRWTAELDMNRVAGNAQERAALQEWLDEGLIDLTQAHDLSAMSSGISTAGRTLMKVASFLPHHTEVFNRVTAGLAGYRLAREAGMTHEAAVSYGKEIIANAHFDYSASNKPYYMSPGFSKVSKLIFMFKQYQQHMIYALSRNLYQSFNKNATAEERRVARRALFGLLSLTSVAAGATGLPFFGTAMLLASLIQGIAGDDDEPWDPDVEFRRFLADAFGVEGGELVAKGVLRKTGLDLSQRLGLGDLIFRYTGKDAVGKDAFNQLLLDMLGPVASLGGTFATSTEYFSRGQYARGWEQLMPKVVKDVMKARRYSEEGLATARGVTRMKPEEFSTYDILAQAMGFTPQKVAEHYAAEGAVQGAKNAIDLRRQQLITLATLARAHGDTEQLREAMEKARAFSRKNPRQAITAESLIRSFRQVKEAELLANQQGVYVKPKDRNLLLYGAFANVGD